MTTRTLLLACILAYSPLSAAQSSEDNAVKAQAAWSAFECSALAEAAEKPAEAGALRTVGFEQGKAFVIAYQAGKITKKDIDANVPVDFLYLLEGPSVDFMLGRLYESIRDYVGEEIAQNVDPEDDEAVRLRASVRFGQRNCKLFRITR